MDVALEPCEIYGDNQFLIGVSILVLVDVALEQTRQRRPAILTQVSILVLVDVALELSNIPTNAARCAKFQSLF